MKILSFPANHLPGQGFSCSSVGAVLDSGIELLVQPDGSLLLASMREFRANVAIRALARERAAGRASVAADDVYPIVHGGAVLVESGPDAVDADGAVSCGSVRANALAVDRRWIAEHLVVAVRSGGIRHEVPSLFTNLFRDPSLARSSVQT